MPWCAGLRAHGLSLRRTVHLRGVPPGRDHRRRHPPTDVLRAHGGRCCGHSCGGAVGRPSDLQQDDGRSVALPRVGRHCGARGAAWCVTRVGSRRRRRSRLAPLDPIHEQLPDPRQPQPRGRSSRDACGTPLLERTMALVDARRGWSNRWRCQDTERPRDRSGDCLPGVASRHEPQVRPAGAAIGTCSAQQGCCSVSSSCRRSGNSHDHSWPSALRLIRASRKRSPRTCSFGRPPPSFSGSARVSRATVIRRSRISARPWSSPAVSALLVYRQFDDEKWGVAAATTLLLVVGSPALILVVQFVVGEAIPSPARYGGSLLSPMAAVTAAAFDTRRRGFGLAAFGSFVSRSHRRRQPASLTHSTAIPIPNRDAPRVHGRTARRARVHRFSGLPSGFPSTRTS